MSRRNRLLRQLEQRWIDCYGEPPPIRTDPKLMLAVLEALAMEAADAAAESLDPAPPFHDGFAI